MFLRLKENPICFEKDQVYLQLHLKRLSKIFSCWMFLHSFKIWYLFQQFVRLSMLIFFFPFHFIVKDLHKGAHPLCGLNKDDDFELLPSSIRDSKCKSLVMVDNRTSIIEWYWRLGNVCQLCQCNKSNWLIFNVFSLKSNVPLELIHVDGWAPRLFGFLNELVIRIIVLLWAKNLCLGVSRTKN